MSSFTSSRLSLESDIPFGSRLYTAAITPLRGPNETVLVDCILHSYIIRGVDQTNWDNLIHTQLVLQLVIMAVEFVASVVGLLLTFIPMRRFIVSLENTFNIDSMSQKEREKVVKKASTFISELGIPGVKAPTPVQ